jgi:hypothetical protein
MPRRRPTAVLVIAILQLLFGGLGLFCSICGGVMDMTGMPRMQAQPADSRAVQQARRKEVTEQVLPERIPLYWAYTVTNRVSSLLSSILMVVSGVGLLLMRSWGRWLAVVYAALSLLVNLVGFVYTILFFNPAYAEVFRRLPPQSDEEQLASTFARVGGPALSCGMMIYPLAVLVILLLPSVGAAFRPRKKRVSYRDIEMT